jgi:hypothetical protein
MVERWKAFQQTKAYAQIRTLLKVFIGGVGSYFIVNGFNEPDPKAVAIAGVTAILVWLVNFLNPSYTNYGVGS